MHTFCIKNHERCSIVIHCYDVIILIIPLCYYLYSVAWPETLSTDVFNYHFIYPLYLTGKFCLYPYFQ